MGTVISCGALLICVSLASLIMAAPAAHAIVKKEFIKPITAKPAAGTRVNVEADRITFDLWSLYAGCHQSCL
jgi:hypothetical protein